MIDQKFMNQFRLLPEMKQPGNVFKVPQALLESSNLSAEEAGGTHMRCSGCGGKVGADILDSVLAEIKTNKASGVVCGLDDARDAAIFNTGGQSIVQSVDQITAVCDDPYVFGRIAAVHALSDLYTTGATAHSAQVLVSLPFADRQIVRRDLQQLMAGVVDALNEDGCALLGGHTSEGRELALGFVVNGLHESDTYRDDHNRGDHNVSAGDCLILTKPVGTGVLLAGLMRQQAEGIDVQSALTGMQQSNRLAAEVLFNHGVKAVTDITGFGLIGHLQRMLQPLNAGARINAQEVPMYSGAMSLADEGIASTLLEQNQQVLAHIECDEDIPDMVLNLFCDPQTSGGLLGVVPAEQCDAALSKLRQQGCESAQVIGTISESTTIQLAI